MKLSPEVKQAIRTAIEQLRLLLVDDAMDTVREQVASPDVLRGVIQDEDQTEKRPKKTEAHTPGINQESDGSFVVRKADASVALRMAN
ncbi:hypothetical protein ACE3YX_001454 [Salmonella enterica]